VAFDVLFPRLIAVHALGKNYRELKEALGLDYEDWQWLVRHHHVTSVSMAFAFLKTEPSLVKKPLV